MPPDVPDPLMVPLSVPALLDAVELPPWPLELAADVVPEAVDASSPPPHPAAVPAEIARTVKMMRATRSI
jgi:hypothetical protein